jgi:hypothetical protein
MIDFSGVGIAALLRRSCRRCRHDFGWFDSDVAQLTVRAETGTVSTAVSAPSADFQIPARSTDELGQAPHFDLRADFFR